MFNRLLKANKETELYDPLTERCFAEQKYLFFI